MIVQTFRHPRDHDFHWLTGMRAQKRWNVFLNGAHKSKYFTTVLLRVLTAKVVQDRSRLPGVLSDILTKTRRDLAELLTGHGVQRVSFHKSYSCGRFAPMAVASCDGNVMNPNRGEAQLDIAHSLQRVPERFVSRVDLSLGLAKVHLRPRSESDALAWFDIFDLV